MSWGSENQRYLTAELARVRGIVEHRARDHPPRHDPGADTNLPDLTPPPALHALVTVFGLTGFERDLLLLCAGTELDTAFAESCAAAFEDGGAPTFGFALAVLPEPHWSALAPTAPLRWWHLLELGPHGRVVDAPLRIDERVLHQLAGLSYLDERLGGLAEPVPAPDRLPPSHDALADRLANDLVARAEPAQLCGEAGAGLEDVAAAACERVGRGLLLARASELPSTPAERLLLARLWEREAALSQRALLIVVDDGDAEDVRQATAEFVRAVDGVVLLGGREPLRLSSRTLARHDVPRPSGDEQEALWRDALGADATRLNGRIDELVNQFDLGRRAIVEITEATLHDAGTDLGADLWQRCRSRSRVALDDLAQRITSDAGWDDLVLPEAQTQILRQIVLQIRHRGRVHRDWGFEAKSARGLGISALFAGPSGTGKTLAAEILAHELALDLYRIDLSQVVSKYIGETEKNLRRVFDAAERAGSVLLFDEADALFGKRSEVKDSHDRYANIEVGYLLQRMEAYRGVAVLTTNLQSSLDPAFTRRIRFIVQFPFPGVEERAAIWRRAFPAATPTGELDLERLAQLNVTGGSIRNIALGAAFLAADEGGEPAVGMAHVLRAARGEYAKLDRTLTGAEVRGWVT
jgi:AAA+ superfamily predicted ATPase